MCQPVRNIAILGSTGSVGRNTLEVIGGCRQQLRAIGLTANSRLERLCQQARQADPQWIVATDKRAASEFDWSGLPDSATVLQGPAGVEHLVTRPEVDLVVAAIVGSAGLRGTWAALDAGKTVALANKETLVMAGPLVMQLAAERNAAIVPVDSEHSAIFQALQAGQRQDVKRVVLTASGGPFRELDMQRLNQVSVEDALAHPTWDMGPKITVDSATMMNKALEIVEARWLFDLRPEQIEVVIHPQSIVHSMVEFIDGSVVAQLSPPDMKLPIQYALSYPHRWDGPAPKLDWSVAMDLSFEPPDYDRFPAIELGFEVARQGGTTGAVLNAANEIAVEKFLQGDLRFTEITAVCRSVLENHPFEEHPTLERLIELDRWARQEVEKWNCPC